MSCEEQVRQKKHCILLAYLKKTRMLEDLKRDVKIKEKHFSYVFLFFLSLLPVVPLPQPIPQGV